MTFPGKLYVQSFKYADGSKRFIAEEYPESYARIGERFKIAVYELREICEVEGSISVTKVEE